MYKAWSETTRVRRLAAEFIGGVRRHWARFSNLL